MYMVTTLLMSMMREQRASVNLSRDSSWKKLAAAISSSRSSRELTLSDSQPPQYKNCMINWRKEQFSAFGIH